MKAATLFSGIGAPEVAMPGWRWLWHAEIEKFPAAVMAARHPQSVNLGDVSDGAFVEKALAAGRPDCLVFGSPCQSFSLAGRRLGLDDPRGNLALRALAVVDGLAPRWFVFENVPGLLSSAEGADFGLFLRAVDELGYSGGWAMLDAQYFGVAQQRERLFFVGHAGDWRGPAAVLFEPEGLRGHSAPRRQARGRVAGGAEVGADSGLPDVAWALQEWDAKGADSDTKAGHLIVEPMAFSAKDYGADAMTGLSPPLRAGQFDASHANGGVMPAMIKHNLVRRLTPRECERLQGFPDDFTLVRYRGKMAADGPRYKALGNSMAVPVMRWLLGRIEHVDQLMRASNDRSIRSRRKKVAGLQAATLGVG